MQDKCNCKGGFERRPVATGFFVGVMEAPDYLVSYVVTARHLIDGSRSNGALHARFNTIDETFVDVEIPSDSWIPHPVTDVAMAQVKLPVGTSASYVPVDKINGDGDIDLRDVSEGTAINYVAFFSQHYGKKRILPVLRSGIIALMPHEPVHLKVGPDYYVDAPAYLAETISISGHSGSPVFVSANMRLLGILQGHYELDQYSDYNLKNVNQVKGGTTTGIAVIIPSQAILDLINRDDVKEDRKLSYELHKESLTKT